MEEKRAELQQLGDRIRDGILEKVNSDVEEKAMKDLGVRLVLSLIFVVAILVVYWTIQKTLWTQAIQAILLIPILVVNHRVFIDGFSAVWSRRPEKNTLAAIATIMALIVLRFDAAGLFLTTMALCRYSEAYVNYKLDDHLIELIEAEPETDPEDPRMVPGSVITVPKGARFPADGIILSGSPAIDEELITGERVPAEKEPGQPAFAGTKNLSHEVELRVTRSGEETTISRIIDHITGSIATRAPISARAERIARRFVFVVIIVAALAALGWSAYGQEAGTDVMAALMTAALVLIIASPYAFSVGVPMAVLAATERGAKNGILIRSADILELARDINTIVMNKTGTITAGKPEISDVISLEDGFNLKLAGTLEKTAHHPMGREICRAAEARHGELPEPEEVRFVPGRGLEADLEGRTYFVGNAAFMEEKGISINLPAAEPLFTQRKSVVFFATGHRVIGLIALRDGPRPISLKAISQIEDMGIDAVMLTGDCARTSEAIRAEVGMDRVFAQILPEEKAGIIEGLRGIEVEQRLEYEAEKRLECGADRKPELEMGRRPELEADLVASNTALPGRKTVADQKPGQETDQKPEHGEDRKPDPEKGLASDTALPGRKTVAMVGDGTDDAPAIAAADIGIAIGTGPDLGQTEADVILIADDPTDVIRAINLSRRTIRIIRQNMAFAYCYNILAVLVAASILVPLAGLALAPFIATLCMCLSQVLVVASTLRVKRTPLT